MPLTSRLQTIKKMNARLRSDLATLATYVYKESFIKAPAVKPVINPQRLRKFRELTNYAFNLNESAEYYLPYIKLAFKLHSADNCAATEIFNKITTLARVECYEALLATFDSSKPFEYYSAIIKKIYQLDDDTQAKQIYAKLGKLELNRKQLNKYQRLQFVFDPNNAFEYYQETFKKAFTVTQEEALKIFEKLSNAHPQGVEIWVNPNQSELGRITPHPLVENTAQLTADSIFSSASKILINIKKHQQQIYLRYFKDDQQIVNNERLTRKYHRILANIEHEYLRTTKEIDKLYRWQFRHNPAIPDSLHPEFLHFQRVKQLIDSFQSYTVSQLAACEQFEASSPLTEDYQRLFKQLNIEEQSIKYNGLVAGTITTEQDKAFNRDIIGLDILECTADHSITKARVHYYDRHYQVTLSQLSLLQQQQQAVKIIDPYAPQPTATAHSSNHFISNYALCEEGNYLKNRPGASDVEITLLTQRYGSPSPTEHYKTKFLGFIRNSHETTYYSYLNMQQVLHNLRVKIIKSILIEDLHYSKSSLADIEKMSQVLAFNITELIHNRNLRRSQLSDEGLIQKAWQQLIYQETTSTHKLGINKDLFGFKLFGQLKKYTNEILYIKNLHNHIITPSGIASFNSKQRYYYQDARIAQHATCDGEGGYVYMANGVDVGRYFSVNDLAQKMHGNNCAALAELYCSLQRNLPLENGNQYKVSSEYLMLQANTQAASKKYLAFIEHVYLPQKIKYDRLKAELADKQLLLQQLTKFSEKLQDDVIKNLTKKIKRLQKEIKTEKPYLQSWQQHADELRKQVKQKESQFYETAEAELRRISYSVNNNNSFESCINAMEASPDPEMHIRYLAWKAFSYSLRLFSKTSLWFGLAKWKLSSNNGLMQALIQITAELAQIFASSGCKSANDRELLLALILAKIAELFESDKTFDIDKLKSSIIEDSQAAFAWHISARQTALDRSAIPKTAFVIMQHAKQILIDYANRKPNETTSYSSHTQYKALAADKRKKRASAVTQSQLAELSRINCHNQDFDIYKQWHKNKWLIWGKYKKIDRCLLTIATERGLSVQEKLDEYKELEQLCLQKSNNNAVKLLLRNIAARKYLLLAEKSAEMQRATSKRNSETQTLSTQTTATRSEKPQPEVNETIQYQQLKSLLDLLKQFIAIPKIVNDHGEGIIKIHMILDGYNPNQASLVELLNIFIKIQEVSTRRNNDLQGRYNMTLFSHYKRPQWLRELYQAISQANLGNLNLSQIVGQSKRSSFISEMNKYQSNQMLMKAWDNYKKIAVDDSDTMQDTPNGFLLMS